jgi:hypothetical protein
MYAVLRTSAKMLINASHFTFRINGFIMEVVAEFVETHTKKIPDQTRQAADTRQASSRGATRLVTS